MTTIHEFSDDVAHRMIHLFRYFTTILFALLAGFSVAGAEERVALVIGNSDYHSARPLPNPAIDAPLVAKALEAAGFEVSLLVDADQNTMERAVSDLGQRLRVSGGEATGLFYFAGHGLQSGGETFLVPVDADVEDLSEIDLYGLPAERVLRQLLSARNRTNILVLDAGHAFPFEMLGELDPPGLAEMDSRRGTYLIYSAKPGTSALDGDAGGPSIFGETFAEAVQREGETVESVFIAVRNAVVQRTAGGQVPWRQSALEADFHFIADEEIDPRERLARQIWTTIRPAGDPVQIIGYLRNYPDSANSDEARMMLMQLLEAELAPPETGEDPLESMDASPTEKNFFRRARASGSIDSYKAYLGTFPDAVFADLAYAEIAAQELWRKLSRRPDPAQIIMFLRSYPDSSVSDDARDRLRAWLADEVEPQVAASSAAAPEPAGGSGATPASERDFFRRAQDSGAIEDYEAYLAEFPNGVFVEFAMAEIRALQDADATPSGPATEPEPAEEVAAVVPEPPAQSAAIAPTPAGQPVRFDEILSRGVPQIDGRSIAQIIEGSPQYPPIEGLPDEVWKEKTCSNCHKWNRERLCEQGQTYLTETGAFALDKQHPIDGFKQVLRDWAAGDCE